jgi:hypothetical protein
MQNNQELLRRAKSLDEMLQKLKGISTQAGEDYWKKFQARPTDVFVTTFAKCGTTWMQQVVHGLRTHGDMDFSEITAVVPWVEMAYDLGINLDAAQKAEPRAFKSHLDADDVPKGGRYVIVIRDPKDAFVSNYRFLEGWVFEPGTISVTEFAKGRALVAQGRRRYWYHLASWLKRRHDDDVLMVTFEDMKRDLASIVSRVAQFIGVPLDDDLLALVVRQSSIEFMREHGRHFDDHLIHLARNQACGLPADAATSKVRSGRVGDHEAVLPSEISDEFDANWQREIAAEFGFDSYDALRDQLAREFQTGN